MPGRCTFTTTSPPPGSRARWTWAMEALASGSGSMEAKSCLAGRPSPFSISWSTVATGMGAALSWRCESSAMKSGGRMSGREERIWPSLMKVGTRSARVSRNRRAEVARISSREGRSPSIRRPSTSQIFARSQSSPNPWRTTTVLISRRRLRSWTAWITRKFFSQRVQQIHLHEDGVAVRHAWGGEQAQLRPQVEPVPGRHHVVRALVRVDQVQGGAGAPFPAQDDVEVHAHLAIVGVEDDVVADRDQLVQLHRPPPRADAGAQLAPVGHAGGEELTVGLQGEIGRERVRRAQGRAHAARLLRGEDVGTGPPRRLQLSRQQRRRRDLPDGPGVLGVGEVQAAVELWERPQHEGPAHLVEALEPREGAALGPVELELDGLPGIGGDVPVELQLPLPLDRGPVLELPVVHVR